MSKQHKQYVCTQQIDAFLNTDAGKEIVMAITNCNIYTFVCQNINIIHPDQGSWLQCQLGCMN